MTLTCDITDGNPIDVIKNVIWRNGDKTLSSGRYHVSGRNLTISSLDHTLDDGQYSCAAENEAGKKGREIITVTTDTKYTGGTVQNPSLTIDPIMRTDGGQYTCQLSNEVGQGYKSVTLEVLSPVKVEYPRIEHIPRTPAFDNQDFNMTCIVSGSGDMKVAWLKDGVSVDTGDFAVTTVQVTDRHYMYGQTDAKKSTLKWRVTNRARYFTCGNITHFDGNYTCAVTTETAGAMTHDVSKAFVVNVQSTYEVEGESKTVTFQIDLVKSGPAREPSDFTILHNHTSIALTLQWHPGYDGGYPPQTYTLQYSASNEVGRKTWSDIFSYTPDAMTWYQATVTGLQPQTQYVFSLYAENNRPQDQGPNRSLTVTQTGSTTGTYARLSKPEQSANLPTLGPTYEEICTGGLTKHSYVNASISCDDGAEYSEVKETATPQEQPTYQNITT
ncbi:hypothetical protein LSAT2_004781 [Lamellibrachia satsuma]|nr:hypothetical protein LSAT2_004781 [Lamellibrachia satsuma]